MTLKKGWISPDGPLTAQYAVVGEAPGTDEVTANRPFVGKSGKLLRALLRENGIEEKCYITNLVKKHLPNNDFKKILATGKDFYGWKDILIKELSSLKKLKVIIAVGAQATNALLCRSDIMNVRGSIYTSPFLNLPVVPIIHPAFIHRNSAAKGFNLIPVTSLDIKKARRIVSEGIYILRKRFFYTIIAPSEAIALLKTFKRGPLSFDIETNPRTNTILILGFATSPLKAWAIDLRGMNEEERTQIYEALKKVTTNPEIELIMHNAQFEMYQCYPFVGKFTCKIFDTMLAFHDCYTHLPKALKFVNSIYTTEPFYKDEINENMCDYNCKDTTVTFEIYNCLKNELKEEKLEYLYYKITLPMIHVAVNARIKGLLVNQQALAEATNFLRTSELKLRKSLNALAPCFINPNSPPDVAWVLFKHLGLRSRGTSTKKEVLKELASKSISPIPQIILDMRELSKLRGFIRHKFWDSDGRCRCTWKLSGTISGRFSMSKELETGD